MSVTRILCQKCGFPLAWCECNALTKMIAELKELSAQCEFFLYESPDNHYQPAPPEGYFAMRSDKRRIFLPNVARSSPERAQEFIAAGEFIESPLDKVIKMPHIQGPIDYLP